MFTLFLSLNLHKSESVIRETTIVMVWQEVEKRPKVAGKLIKETELFEDGEDFGMLLSRKTSKRIKCLP